MQTPWTYAIAALLAAPAYAQPLQTILTCPLADSTHVSLLAESDVEGQRLFIELDGKTQIAFTDMPKSDFIGRIVLAKCAASSLIFALEYGSPYMKGVVLRKNPVSHTVERIDFAEKALPRWLYLGREQIRLVIPNIGYEVSAKFLVYDYVAGKGQLEGPPGIETPPDRRGFKVVRLK
ncbi:hypothetical protein [Pseudomonas sp. P9_31]|uniref:hypothetical protein n=1 Tax=Pseudomonas sp. P9_31 TaxID=3043448 RepID=UPI002A36845A|nr:hypothetical protein [Pseudomonas sp. P9_31]WPN55498.1 hypothetical protein QMK51_15005 [Pseudomonas sp. P9_31]